MRPALRWTAIVASVASLSCVEITFACEPRLTAGYTDGNGVFSTFLTLQVGHRQRALAFYGDDYNSRCVVTDSQKSPTAFTWEVQDGLIAAMAGDTVVALSAGQTTARARVAGVSGTFTVKVIP